MTRKCPGCGKKLQSENPDQLGFIPLNTKNKANICSRCFKLLHYNEAKIVSTAKDAEKIINIVNKKNRYVFFLIDFLNINEETLKAYHQITCEKSLIISKSDIIPKSIKEAKIIEWIKNVYEVQEVVCFVSTNKQYNINLIPNLLEKLMLEEAYVLGFTNAGKSSLIKAIYKNISEKDSLIITSNIPNTTLDFIKIKINDNLTLIDSPGFVYTDNIYENNTIELIKKISTKTFLKPLTYPIKTNESIILEKLFRFYYNSLEKNSLTFYLSGALSLNKIYESNKTLLNKEYKLFDIPDNSDLVIKGIGFINIKNSCQIKIYSKYLNLLEVRPSCFWR